jgi:hypothetical protein
VGTGHMVISRFFHSSFVNRKVLTRPQRVHTKMIKDQESERTEGLNLSKVAKKLRNEIFTNPRGSPR